MKIVPTLAGTCLLALTLTACGSEEKTTVYHERPVVVQPAVSGGATPGSVEMNCAHGYDNSTHSCY